MRSHDGRRSARREPAAKQMVPAIIQSMRPHQWLKNLLVLVPLGFLGVRATTSDVVIFLIGFVLVGLLSSGTYVINDIVDVEYDRKHSRKATRPIASGALSFPVAAIAAAILIGSALAGAFWLSRPFALTLITYLVLTLAYSFYLKRIPLLDVLVIATLFTLRILAGMALVNEPLSHWLLMFSVFFFFSLALMKREVELTATESAGATVSRDRGYVVGDRALLLAFGASSGVASLVVFALFTSAMVEDPKPSYASPEWLWGVLGVVSYWLMRMWLITARGLMTEDPILYAARDRVSLMLAALIVAFVAVAQLVPK